jgi:hypothetical protein
MCVLACGGLASLSARAPSDLDQLVERALAHRDSGWKALPQLVLDERTDVDVLGPSGARFFAQRGEYTWFPQDGVFVRSPLRINGRGVTDAQRQAAEAAFIARERRRDERRRETAPPAESAPERPLTPETAESLTAAMQPLFLSNNSMLMGLRYEPGRYGLVGRETRGGREVVKVEHYPTTLFKAVPARPNQQVRERDRKLPERLNKASLLTLWIDPAQAQIVRYEYADVDLGFLPGQWLSRVVDGRASMSLDEVLPGIWLPTAAESLLRLQSPAGPVEYHFSIAYTNYRRAEVGTRIVK